MVDLFDSGEGLKDPWKDIIDEYFSWDDLDERFNNVPENEIYDNPEWRHTAALCHVCGLQLVAHGARQGCARK